MSHCITFGLFIWPSAQLTPWPFVVFLQSATTVQVSNANAPAGDHLLVGGYDVSGEVRSDGEPMKEVTFLLYSATVSGEVNLHYWLFQQRARSGLEVACFNSIILPVCLTVRLVLVLCLQDVVGCNSSPVEGAESGDDSLVYLCSALSGDDGAFIFPSLPSGEYTVVRTHNSLLMDLILCCLFTQSWNANI